MHDSVTIIPKAIITKARFSKKEKKFNNGQKKKIDKGTSSSRTRPAAERKPNALGDEAEQSNPRDNERNGRGSAHGGRVRCLAA